jgi:predicted cobalt transporter CbtA
LITGLVVILVQMARVISLILESETFEVAAAAANDTHGLGAVATDTSKRSPEA